MASLLLKFRKKTGVPAATLQTWISTFEFETPELCNLMKKRSRDITSNDYKSLQTGDFSLKSAMGCQNEHLLSNSHVILQ
jgi:hypothetical protein